MIRATLLAAALAALPAVGMAQTWQGTTSDTGGLIYGGASAPARTLTFTCTAPSPQRRPLIETEDHKTIQSVPFGMFVSLSAALVPPPGGEAQLPAVTLTLDGTGYRLPPLRWDELYYEWMVELAMADPLFGALSAASDLVLDSGTGAAWRYPVDGLAQGLSAAMSACAAGWVQTGLTLPPELGGAAPNPQAAATAQMTPEIDSFLRRGCEAGYTIVEGAITLHDLDRDGMPDRILDWAGVTCGGSIPRPFCGAANCSIDIFLSSRPGDPQSFLGVGYTVTQAANGAPGLRFGGTAGACARGECDRVFWWDGSRFRE
jgi:hypothetical protein